MANFATSTNADPLRSYKYQVSLTPNKTLKRAGFQSIKGLKMQTKEVEYREGGDNMTTRKLPGLTKFPNVTFMRGYISTDNDLYEWATQVFNVNNLNQPVNGGSFRNDVKIDLMQRDGTIARTWTLYSAWVTDYSPGDWDAEKEAVFVNTIIVAHEGFDEK